MTTIPIAPPTFTWSNVAHVEAGDAELEFRPLPAPFGAEVLGVDLAATVDDATADALRHAMALYDVLVFPGQVLTPDDEIRTLRLFFPDIAPADNGWGLALPGHPEILLLSNVVEPGEPIGFHNTIGMGWHIDGVGWDPPPGLSSLYCVEMPPWGTVTWFSSGKLAYDLLPDATKRDLEHRVAYSDFIASQRWLAANSSGHMEPIPDEEIENYPPVPVPLVLTDPVTGRRSLFFNQSACHADRTPDPDTSAFLAGIIEEATSNPHNRVAIPWQPHQLVLWNNRTMFHSAPDYDAAGARRVFHQMTGRGPSIPLPDDPVGLET